MEYQEQVHWTGIGQNLKGARRDVIQCGICYGSVEMKVNRESFSASALGEPLISCTPLPKAEKSTWFKQLIQLSCLMVRHLSRMLQALKPEVEHVSCQ